MTKNLVEDRKEINNFLIMRSADRSLLTPGLEYVKDLVKKIVN